MYFVHMWVFHVLFRNSHAKTPFHAAFRPLCKGYDRIPAQVPLLFLLVLVLVLARESCGQTLFGLTDSTVPSTVVMREATAKRSTGYSVVRTEHCVHPS
jgi:hypothetical protein